MAPKGGSLSFSFFLPIDMDQRLSASSAKAPVQSRVIPLSSDVGIGCEGWTENSGMAVDGLKSTSDIPLMLSFREDGKEEGEEGSLELKGKGFEGGVWGCPVDSVELGPTTLFCFKRASRRAFNFNAL